MASRNALLLLSKKELIKQCKKKKLNTLGCLAKMDYVKLLLDSNDNKKVKKKSKKIKKRKNESFSEPMPMPSDVDPSSFAFEDDDIDDDDAKIDVNNSPLPWQIKLDAPKNEIIDVETNVSPRESNKIVKIKPSLMNNLSLKVLPDANDECDDENENDDEKENGNIIEQIDAALGDYYKVFDRNDYFDKNKNGKFITYCKDNGLDTVEELDKYFGNDTDIEPVECKYLDFDSTFPLNEYAPLEDENEMDKKLMTKIEIYNVIEYCYHHRKSPY